MGNSEGASAIEFAIILNVFFLLIMGMVEFGLAFSMRQVIVNASREGARYGIAYKVDSLGNRILPMNLAPSIQTWVLTPPPDGGVGLTSLLPADANPWVRPTVIGPSLRVEVGCYYRFLVLNRFIPLLPDNMEMGAVTVMRLE